jgi:2,3-bisphosphoglycerate-dependent phosphoglycerate mutase
VLIVSFVRHGSTAWNEAGRMQGRRDIPLSAAGRRDVATWRLPATDAAAVDWVSSPLSRAIDTAHAMSGAPPRIEPALTEMDWGAWEGCGLAELRTRFGAAFDDWERRGLDFRPDGGESPRDVVRRVAPWLASLGRADRPVVAVTHKGVLRALYALATGWNMLGKPPVKLQPACLHRFALARDGNLTLVEPNVPLARRDAAGALAREPTQPPAP